MKFRVIQSVDEQFYIPQVMLASGKWQTLRDGRGSLITNFPTEEQAWAATRDKEITYHKRRQYCNRNKRKKAYYDSTLV